MRVDQRHETEYFNIYNMFRIKALHTDDIKAWPPLSCPGVLQQKTVIILSLGEALLCPLLYRVVETIKPALQGADERTTVFLIQVAKFVCVF